ncbi:AlpA family phage regulatory protein [Pseudoalteromonas sp. ESRF-bin5]|uniref:helix-turn-helix transcriptional regulator n=1 Tax=Pseudoalteromonas sp. ESRF-bin5 TaxID=2014532 RepID=UPI00257A467A|nr:AlpA family phage regulatory protein [Pseudoalteromonas sp. ESRF-bin5]
MTINNDSNLRLQQAADYLGISKVTLYRLGENDKTFPKKIRLSSRCCLYRKADLDQWLAGKEV